MPDFGTGFLTQEWDPDEQEYISSMDPAQIGEMYYNLDPSNEAESAIFWWDMMQEYLPQNNLMWDDWMVNYSQYLPQDYGIGQAQIARGRRTGLQGIKSMHGDFMDESALDRHSYGTSGFAGTGMQARTGEDIWSRYTSSAKARRSNMEEYQESIWAAHGQNVLNMLSTLGQGGAFNPIDLDTNQSVLEGMFTQEGSDFLGQDDYIVQGSFNNPNEYQWATAVESFCNDPSNSNSMYWDMCGDYAGGGWDMMTEYDLCLDFGQGCP